MMSNDNFETEGMRSPKWWVVLGTLLLLMAGTGVAYAVKGEHRPDKVDPPRKITTGGDVPYRAQTSPPTSDVSGTYEYDSSAYRFRIILEADEQTWRLPRSDTR